MRTKTTVLTAAVLAAGALSSLAQDNVYSLNVVGYINVAIPHGYSLIANQLVNGNNNLQTVLGGNWVSNTQAIGWNPAAQSFTSGDTFLDSADVEDINPSAWYDATASPSTTVLNPGAAFFILNSHAATNVTLVGQVTQGTNTATVSAGYSFLSVIPPVAVDLATNGPLALPAVRATQILTFNSALNTYAGVATYLDVANDGAPVAGWYDQNANLAQIIPAVGQGFVLLSPSASTWTQMFSVQ